MPNLTYSLNVGGVEKSFQEWGICLDFQISIQSKGKSTAILTTIENFDPAGKSPAIGVPATQWQPFQHAIIRANATMNNDGSVVAGSGNIVFQGYFDDPQMVGDSDRQVIQYQLHSVWWLFELNNFKQFLNQFIGSSSTNSRALAATIANGGSNYKVGDILTVPGASGDTPATFEVVAVGSNQSNTIKGIVTLVVTTNGGGNYNNHTFPTGTQTPLSNSAAGFGCQLTLTKAPAPNLFTSVISEVFLGEDLHAAGGYTSLWPNGNGDQIKEIISWINEIYNPTKQGAGVNGLPNAAGGTAAGRDDKQDVVRIGVIEPHTVMPITPTNSIYCSEAILQCLRWDPDAVIFEDPTTTPPTLHVRKLARWTANPDGTFTFVDYNNLPKVSIQITAAQERRILMKSQQSKQLNGVQIYYRSFNVVDGAVYPSIFPDVFPPGTTDYTTRTSAHTIDLLGSRLTHVQELVKVNTTTPFSLLTSGVPANQVTWWLGQDTTLKDTSIDSSTIQVMGGVVINDDNGNPIDTTIFTNELISDLSDWTGQSWVRAHIQQAFQYDKYTDGTRKVRDTSAKGRTHTKVIKLTTAQGQLYTALSSFATAEAIPLGVAESVYRSLAIQQYSGTHELLDTPLRVPVDTTGTAQPNWVGCRLELIGPNTTFENLIIQSVVQEPAFGRTSITFGPGPKIDIGVLIELARATRARAVWNLPSNRGDGGTSGSGQTTVDTSAASPVADTAHGMGGLGYHALSGAIIP